MLVISFFMVLTGIENPYDISREDFPFNWSPLLYLRELYIQSTGRRAQILFFHTGDLLMS